MKTLQELEAAIRDLFIKIYCKEYLAKLKVEELFTYEETHRGYKLTLGLNNIDKPLIISFEGDDKGFLKFLASELRERRLDSTLYFMGYKYYIEPENCEKK